ncbi:hypothetical protein X777_02245 [Ooceraea biroi]|uniref:Uncharacterized protein n=1 Tax=Ooceraea biroi TaxID=2015173 RepID=A0A026WLX7_OOCBI|nr:hypothetical protein X777_02245 [Ooceraea biroi]
MICRGIVFIENESTAREIRRRPPPRTRADHGGGFIGSFAMMLVVVAVMAVVVVLGRSLWWLDVWTAGNKGQGQFMAVLPPPEPRGWLAAAMAQHQRRPRESHYARPAK